MPTARSRSIEPVGLRSIEPVEIRCIEPVEINAGAWYLRALRADGRLSDVPALADLGVADPAAYVAAAQPADEPDDAEDDAPVRCVWAVCVPTTGELVALLGVTGDPAGGTAILRGVHRAGFVTALADAVDPVRRFAAQALGLTVGAHAVEVP